MIYKISLNLFPDFQAALHRDYMVYALALVFLAAARLRILLANGLPA